MVRKTQRPLSKKPLARRSTTKRTSFGPVSAITTAPVAIGNSMRGAKPVVTVTADGCRIQGRDFAFQVGATVAAATDWTLVGGMPLTPCVMPATTLKSYAQMYGQFKFNALAVHYITSSATSQTGDVMFYYERDRTGPAIDCTSSSFLPFVLSDDNTVIGPQWTNHTAIVRPDPEFKSTDYGMNPDLNEEANGTVFIYSKTSAANSPGYVILDYDITFKQLQSNPRAGLLPVARGNWTQLGLGVTTTSVTQNTTAVLLAVQGNTVAGTASALPTGTISGDVFKCIFDITNSTVTGVNAAWTSATAANAFRYITRASAITFTLDDGFTCYAVYDSAGGGFNLYPTLTAALTNTEPITWGVTASVTVNIACYVSLVASVNARLQNSY